MTTNYASHKNHVEDLRAIWYKVSYKASNESQERQEEQFSGNDILFILGNKYHSVRFDSRGKKLQI